MIVIDRQSSMGRQGSESCGAVIIDIFKMVFWSRFLSVLW